MLAWVNAVVSLFAVLILTGLLPTFGDGELSDVEQWVGWVLVVWGGVMIVVCLHNARLCGERASRPETRGEQWA